MNLYEINKEILNCIKTETGETINAETGEVISIQQLNELEMQRNEKIKNIALWIKNLNADVNAFEDELKTLTARKKAAKAKVEQLKKWLSLNLDDGEKITDPKFAISWRASERVTITDEHKIPECYLKYAEPTIDKVAIKKAIKNGDKVDGVVIEKNKTIQIK
jgi:hypothetical protein|nr:MAG TPA: resistance protein [Caudoviricetes sp.]